MDAGIRKILINLRNPDLYLQKIKQENVANSNSDSGFSSNLSGNIQNQQNGISQQNTASANQWNLPLQSQNNLQHQNSIMNSVHQSSLNSTGEKLNQPVIEKTTVDTNFNNIQVKNENIIQKNIQNAQDALNNTQSAINNIQQNITRHTNQQIQPQVIPQNNDQAVNQAQQNAQNLTIMQQNMVQQSTNIAQNVQVQQNAISFQKNNAQLDNTSINQQQNYSNKQNAAQNIAFNQTNNHVQAEQTALSQSNSQFNKSILQQQNQESVKLNGNYMPAEAAKQVQQEADKVMRNLEKFDANQNNKQQSTQNKNTVQNRQIKLQNEAVKESAVKIEQSTQNKNTVQNRQIKLQNEAVKESAVKIEQSTQNKNTIQNRQIKLQNEAVKESSAKIEQSTQNKNAVQNRQIKLQNEAVKESSAKIEQSTQNKNTVQNRQIKLQNEAVKESAAKIEQSTQNKNIVQNSQGVIQNKSSQLNTPKQSMQTYTNEVVSGSSTKLNSTIQQQTVQPKNMQDKQISNIAVKSNFIPDTAIKDTESTNISKNISQYQQNLNPNNIQKQTILNNFNSDSSQSIKDAVVQNEINQSRISNDVNRNEQYINQDINKKILQYNEEQMNNSTRQYDKNVVQTNSTNDKSLNTEQISGLNRSVFVKSILGLPQTLGELLFAAQNRNNPLNTNTLLLNNLNTDIIQNRKVLTQIFDDSPEASLNIIQNIQTSMTQATMQQAPQNDAITLIFSGMIKMPEISELILKNSRHAIMHLMSAIASASKSGLNTDEIKNTLNIINSCVSLADASNPVQTLKSLMLLYLPWLPLNEGVGFDIEAETPSGENKAIDSKLTVLIQTKNYGNVKGVFTLTTSNSVDVYIICTDDFPKRTLQKSLKEEGMAHSMNTSVDIESVTPLFKDNNLNQEAKVNLSATNEMNPYLLLMAHAFIRNTIAIDSVGVQEAMAADEII